MKKKIFKYLDKNASGITRKEAVRILKKDFKINEIKALKYYDEWRAEFVKPKYS